MPFATVLLRRDQDTYSLPRLISETLGMGSSLSYRAVVFLKQALSFAQVCHFLTLSIQGPDTSYGDKNNS